MRRNHTKSLCIAMAESIVHAYRHTYPKEIQYSIENSKIYTPESEFKPTSKKSVNHFILVDSAVEKIIPYLPKDKSVCVLNTADYRHPGGSFTKGTITQEETLCFVSSLYPVLDNFQDYYEWNRRHLNHNMYKNRAIYSPDIVFPFHNTYRKCNVLSCSAPNNIASVKRYYSTSDVDKNYDAFVSRIRFICDILAEQKLNIVVLNAFGCDTLRQDPWIVANLFRKYLYNIDTVLFAVSNEEQKNAFMHTFKTNIIYDAKNMRI